jgi:hypothetical protein
MRLDCHAPPEQASRMIGRARLSGRYYRLP